MSNFHFRMPRAVDPRRHHDVVEWTKAERAAGAHSSPLGWRGRVVYGLLGAGVLVVVLPAVVRLL